MTLHHFPHQAIDGRWHVVTRDPITAGLESVDDFPTEVEALAEAEARNANHGVIRGQCESVNSVSRPFHGSRQAEWVASGVGMALMGSASLRGASVRSGRLQPTTSASTEVMA